MSDLGTWICEEAASADDFISEDSKLEDDRAALVASEEAAAVRDSWKQNIFVLRFFSNLDKNNLQQLQIISSLTKLGFFCKNCF